MSHFIPIPIQGQYTNQDVLFKALATLGFKEITSNSEKVFMRGFYGDLSNRKAEIVIPKHSNNIHSDAGFSRQNNGEFTLDADSYDRLQLQKRLENLQKTYAEESVAITLEAANKTARKANKGQHFIERKTLPNGDTCLTLAWESDVIAANQVVQQY